MDGAAEPTDALTENEPMSNEEKVELIQQLTEEWRFCEEDEPLRDRTFFLMWRINDIINEWGDYTQKKERIA